MGSFLRIQTFSGGLVQRFVLRFFVVKAPVRFTGYKALAAGPLPQINQLAAFATEGAERVVC